MQLRLRPVLGGLASAYAPSLFRHMRAHTTGRTWRPAYCYDVWFAHLADLRAAGMTGTPGTLLELGPGGSVGIGLAALLSGVERYVGLDVEADADVERSLGVLDGLVPLLRKHKGAARDGSTPPLVAESDVAAFTDPARLEDLRDAVRKLPNPDDTSPIGYRAPWDDPTVLEDGSVDLVISESVLEHVTDLATLHGCCARWLRPGGRVSHVVNLKSHGITRDWNGHWAVSEGLWRVTVGNRPYLINRLPASEHLALMERAGIDLEDVRRTTKPDGIGRAQLAARFATLGDEDLHCAGLRVVGRKTVG